MKSLLKLYCLVEIMDGFLQQFVQKEGCRKDCTWTLKYKYSQLIARYDCSVFQTEIFAILKAATSRPTLESESEGWSIEHC